MDEPIELTRREWYPTIESWVSGRRIDGTVSFAWLKGEPMPKDCARLQHIHMADTIEEGELPLIGKARFRVNRFSTSCEATSGMWRADVGIEVLDA